MCVFSGVQLTADGLMDRLDNGVLLCQLAQLLQEKMIHTNNSKVLQRDRFRSAYALYLIDSTDVCQVDQFYEVLKPCFGQVIFSKAHSSLKSQLKSSEPDRVPLRVR